MKLLNKNKIKYIVVHCTATREGKDYDAKWLRNLHVNQNKWEDIGYHYVVKLDGTVEKGRDEKYQGAHAYPYNGESIGVVYVGGTTADATKAKDTRTDAQKVGLIKLLTVLKAKYPNAEIVGHRDLSPDKNKDGKITPNEWTKACPCFDAREEYKNI